MKRRIILSSVLVLAFFFYAVNAEYALAKFPEKKIRFVVPWAPGGGADIMARSLHTFVNPYLDNRVYVENILGGAASIGYREGAKASPDGYTITMMVTSMMTSSFVVKDYPRYDLFDPICVVALDSTMLSVKWDSQFKTANDIISYAKMNPGKVSIGTAGYGAGDHLLMEALSRAIGTKFNLVPHKSTGPSLVAAAGGHVDASVSGCSDAIALVEGKKLRPLVIFSTKGSPLYPDVPTIKGLGYNETLTYWKGVGVPKGTPKEIKEILAEAFRKAVESEGFKKLMSQMNIERIYLGPEEAGPWLKGQYDFFKSVATKIGIQPE
jgi:tripartite-type tricarboxylate transporter receptor subunit TctC